MLALGISAESQAGGKAPVTRGDTIIVVRGGTADRLADGNDSVLDNDFDREGDPMTARLDRDVSHGTLTFREDGTFLYEHDGSTGDSDSFRYRAYDDRSRSNRATVNIIVEDIPNTPPSVVNNVPNQEATQGAAFRIELAGFFTDPDDGDILTFSASGLPRSGSLSINSATGVLSGTPGGSDARDNPYNVKITATDRAGAEADLTFALAISAQNRADVVLDVRLLENPVTVGAATKWTLNVENRGPSELAEGQLDATWTTSGPALTLTVPGSCQLSGNATSSPAISCAVGALAANTSLAIALDGVLDGDGDLSLIGVVTADDPIVSNNSDIASAQIVRAFSEGPSQSINIRGNDVDVGDLDGDGLNDIVATASETRIFFNNGARAATTPGVSLGAGSGGKAIVLLDWNGDGSLDVAVGGTATADVEIFVNDKNGNFASADKLQNGGFGDVNRLATADLNNNGSDDLIVAGSSATKILTRLTQGGIDAVSLSSGAGRDVATADMNRDGVADIVVVRAGDRAVDLHYNNGDGTSFTQSRRNEGSVATVSAFDFNGDGTPDLALGLDGNDLSPPQHKLLIQQGGDFSSGGTFGASPITAILPGDVDLDGQPDIVAINAAGVHQLYIGGANNNFTLASEQIVSSGMTRGLLVDFNNDQSLDLVLVGSGAQILEIHANNGNGRLGLGDRGVPTLQLIDGATIQVPSGAPFVDPGATAIDDIDGDLTSQIVVSGRINTNVLGTQSLTYSVTDRAGNKATAVRTVQVGANAGTGGGGSGSLSPLFAVLLLMLTLPALAQRSCQTGHRIAINRLVSRFRPLQ
jgi:hypothetical protein